MGSTNIPRYWITLGKEIIWDYPKDFVDTKHPGRRDIKDYPYGTDVPNISKLIREYIDTPKEEIFTKEFENDYWGLVEILRASDKRIGTRRLEELKAKVDSAAARKVIDARQKSANKKLERTRETPRLFVHVASRHFCTKNHSAHGPLSTALCGCLIDRWGNGA